MKKNQIIIGSLILMLIIFFIPSISYGAEFRIGVSGLNHAEAWFTGIFAAMRHYQGGWIDTGAPFALDRGRITNYAEFGDENYSWYVFDTGLASRFPGETGNISLMKSVGGLCFGHQHTNNYGKAIVPKMLITIDNPTSELFHNYDTQILAYAVKNSWQRHEVGTSATQYYKASIARWINERAGNYGLLIQQEEGYLSNLDQIQREGYNDINGMANEKFTTNSTGGEGATQSIEYKNGDTFIGPYNLNTSWGNLTNATITLRDNAGTISTSYASLDGTNITSLNQISTYNGNSFYIVVKGQEVESVAKITLEKYYRYNAIRIIAGEGTGQNVAIFYGEERYWTGTLELPEVPYSNIKIKKVDKDTNQPLKESIGFIVYNQTLDKWLKEGTKMEYVDNKEDATTFYTNANGEVTIKNISEKGTYIVYEVVNPNFGYEVATYDEPSQEVVAEIAALGQNVELNITNDRKYIRISGYVWEDMISEKMSVRNWLWQNDSNDTADRRVMNVEVTLKKADGTVIDTRTTGTIIDSNNQEAQGAYLFGDYMRDSNATKIEIEDLDGAYIEFKYNGMCYKSVQVNTNLDNGNKATDDTLRDAFNNNYATVVNGEARNENDQRTYGLTYDYDTNLHTSTLNYGGEYLYGYYEDSSGGRQKYPIAGIDEQYMITANTKDAAPTNLLGQSITIEDILKNSIEEIPNINLGLWEREMPDMVAVEDLDNVKISLNGYEHTYEYAQRISSFEERVNDKEFNVTVSYQNERNPSSYTREFYSSDVVYNKENEESLKVYMTYRVGLKNEANTVNTKVNEIMNYYDSRYTIDSIVDEDGNPITEIYEDPTYAESHDGNTYKRSRIVVNQNVKNQNATQSNEKSGYVNLRYIYIRYELSNDAINSLLNGEATLNSAVEITSYSSFDDENFTSRYAGVDRDSEPGSMRTVDPNTYYEDDTNKAISLILKVKEGRVIRGTVWEDTAIEAELNKTGFDRQRIGDGLYNTGENVVGNVKVELLNLSVDGSGNTTYSVADLYKYNADGTTYDEEASMYTGTNGSYEFSGIIPANYVIRYTYGNTSVIYDSSGNPLGNVNAEKYKSTIYRNGEEPNSNYWYREETGDSATRLSDAKDEIGIKQNGDRVEDIVEERTTQEDIRYATAKEETEDKSLESIEANTAIFDIKLDYDINLDNISKYGVELKFVFDNIDLGIVRRPIQNIDVRKEIAFVELSLANGQTVISGDPRREDIQYLKFMPDGSVHIEIDDELIQGATLKLQYDVIVDNTKAEIDYNDKNYYYYGTVPTGNTGWKLATVTRLFDYLSNGLEFDATDSSNRDWSDIKSEITTSIVTNGFMSQEAYDIAKTYNKVLATEAFATMQPNETKTVQMKVSKLLSNTQSDFSFDNDVEVNTLNGRKMEYVPTDPSQVNPDEKDEYVYATPGNYVPGTGPEVESDDDVKVVVITGPTGENNNYLPYILLGISSFIILGTGIIFIKKKVLE